jgi:hypothetical protein
VQVTVQSDYAVNTAYWSGFCLNNIMQSLVAIFVASSKQLTYTSTDSNGLTKIAYDTVIINEGKAWDTKTMYLWYLNQESTSSASALASRHHTIQ